MQLRARSVLYEGFQSIPKQICPVCQLRIGGNSLSEVIQAGACAAAIWEDLFLQHSIVEIEKFAIFVEAYAVPTALYFGPDRRTISQPANQTT
jgi:hypothetical protein